MKVYIVTEIYHIDFDVDVITNVHKTYETAKKQFEQKVENAKKETEDHVDPDETIVDELEDYFDIYKDGRASEWNITLKIEEKKSKRQRI